MTRAQSFATVGAKPAVKPGVWRERGRASEPDREAIAGGSEATQAGATAPSLATRGAVRVRVITLTCPRSTQIGEFGMPNLVNLAKWENLAKLGREKVSQLLSDDKYSITNHNLSLALRCCVCLAAFA